MGQALLPEHFYAQEQSLREEIDIRSSLREAPTWGLAALRWDEFQLQKGIVSIQELTLVLPSGVLVDVPGNTSPAFLNLATTGATQVSLHVHLQSAYDLTEVGQGDEETVERVVQKIELSPQPYSATGAESFKLVEMECAPDGGWSVRPSFLPPMVRIGDEPLSAPHLERMRALARTLKQFLGDEIQQNHLVAESQVAAKQCLRGLFEFEGLLRDIAGSIRPHPYELYRQLRNLYFDVCIFRDVHPGAAAAAYAHEDFGTCLGQLLGELEQQVHSGPERLPYLEFQRKSGLLACTLGRDVRRAKDVFWLVQKPQVSSKLDLSRVKLASESRIQLVHERALRGIPFQKLETPPLHQGLASNVEFFAVTPGQEWDYAVAEGNVVLFDAPTLEGCRLYLYWRQD
jgi:type VI secretion system protein ImpJ